MRATPYKDVLSRIASYLGEADGLSAEDAILIAPKLNLFVRLAWEYYWWPDFMLIEKRTFRPAWTQAETVTAGAERFLSTPGLGQWSSDTGLYYQALQASTGQAPATLVNGGYVENGAYWAQSQTEYSADLWQPNTNYGVNNDGSGLPYQVQSPVDGQFYQCILAHTSGGSWDATNWGLLKPFKRTIDLDPGATSNQGASATPIGEVRFIWDRDPEVNRYAQKVKCHVRGGYLQVMGTVNVVWVEFRQRPSSYTNTVLSASSGYGSGVTIYDPATGENWLTVSATNAGDTPTNAAAKFQLVPFPYYFTEYVAQSVYAALTNREENAQAGVPENFTIQQTAGFPLLLLELDKIERQQGQTRQLNAVSSRNSQGGWWYRT